MPQESTAAPSQPNIVYVLADDLGWSDVSTPLTTMGTQTRFFETPTVDRLAREGVAFDNAYMSPNCAPTRTALLTGLYPPRPTNDVYLVGNLNRGGTDTLLVGPAQGRLADGLDALPQQSVTIAEVLRNAGYVTGYIGKFHVTRSATDITEHHGFDESWGGNDRGAPGAYHASDGEFAKNIEAELNAYAADYSQEYVDSKIKPYSHGVAESEIDALVGTGVHVTDALTDAAIDFIDRHAARPFFAYLSDYAVHTPVDDGQARADLLAKYRAKPAIDEPSFPAYAALVEGVDQSLARIVAHLETTPDPRNPGRVLADNTLVIFTSDNGGLGRYANNGPLRGQKGELREGGIRVPLVAWSRNRALAGTGITSTPVHAIDLFPTLASLAGVPAEEIDVDGLDLSAVLRDPNESVDRDGIYWHLPGYLVDPGSDGRNQHPQSVLRADRWKLTYDYETQQWSLHDLITDISESHDLAAGQPTLVTRLGTQLITWLAEVEAPLPTLRPGKDPVRIELTGTAYVHGTVSQHDHDVIMVQAGDEMPIFVHP